MNLWPKPLLAEPGSSLSWLDENFTVRYRKVDTEIASLEVFATVKERESPCGALGDGAISVDDLLKIAEGGMRTRLFAQSFVPEKFHPRNTQFEPDLPSELTKISVIEIEESEGQLAEGRAGVIPDEVYTLRVTSDRVLIQIISARGIVPAFATLTQLFYSHSQNPKAVYTTFSPIFIRDGPRFPHRGLNLDISRNCISPADVTRIIEAMSFVKLNRLHLHASDSQSWPLHIPALPELAAKSAYQPSQIWSVADLHNVQRHGLLRGVNVYIEIDMPGHTASIAYAYPELVAAFDQRPWHEFTKEPPAGQLKLNEPRVFGFLTKLFNDLLPRVKPFSALFHLGGDELNLKAFGLDPTVGSESPEVIKPHLQKFVDHAVALVKAHGMIPVFWEEQLLKWELDLPEDAIIQTWRRSEDSLASVVAENKQALFGSASYWYLDCGFGTFLDPDPSNPDTPVRPPFPDWCPPYKNWKHVYAYDPLKNIVEDKRHLILGGEVHLWGELTDSVTLDFMLWPRVAAAAETLWSGPAGRVEETVTRRLAELRERLVLGGSRAGMVQMEWSLRNKGGSTI